MYLEAFHSDKKELEDLKNKYTQGKVGDVEIKNLLGKLLNDFLEPIRTRREFYISHPEEVRKALVEGALRAKEVAQKTISEVKKAMNITGYEDIENIKKL